MRPLDNIFIFITIIIIDVLSLPDRCKLLLEGAETKSLASQLTSFQLHASLANQPFSQLAAAFVAFIQQHGES